MKLLHPFSLQRFASYTGYLWKTFPFISLLQKTDMYNELAKCFLKNTPVHKELKIQPVNQLSD